MNQRFVRGLAGAAALVLGIGCGDAGLQTPSETVSASETSQSKPAPEFTLENIDGGSVSLSDYQGKVVLLNFWATWCGPCKIEMPWFVDFQRRFKDQGFTVLAVSMDEEGPDIVKKFVDDFQLNFPVLVGNDEIDQKYGGIMALPTTIIIDKDGNEVSRHTGLVSKSNYEDEIQGLL